MKKGLVLAAAAAALLFASCTYIFKIDFTDRSAKVKERKDEKETLVYGYINMKSDSMKLDWMSLIQIEPSTEKPYWGAGVKDGLFEVQGMLPGLYCIYKFGTNTGREYMMSYEVGCFETKKSDLYYFGTYEMVWSGGKPQTLRRAFTPGEADVVEKLLEVTDKGTYWEDKLRKRLVVLREAELRKANIPRAPSLR